MAHRESRIIETETTVLTDQKSLKQTNKDRDGQQAKEILRRQETEACLEQEQE